MTQRQKKTKFVVGVTDAVQFGANVGKRCQVLRSFFANGEGWYRLRDAAGREFNSPDIFWATPRAAKLAAA
jgi:hypothetical protein